MVKWLIALIAVASAGAVALPIAVGNTLDPCEAAVNSYLARRPPPAGMADIARGMMLEALRSGGIIECYRALVNEAAN
jgi:hypothetical protein